MTLVVRTPVYLLATRFTPAGTLALVFTQINDPTHDPFDTLQLSSHPHTRQAFLDPRDAVRHDVRA